MFSMGEMTVSMWGCIISTPELSWALTSENLSQKPFLHSFTSCQPSLSLSPRCVRKNTWEIMLFSQQPSESLENHCLMEMMASLKVPLGLFCVILCYIFLPPLLCSPPCIISVSAQVRLFIHCACQFAHFLSASFSQTRTKYFSIILFVEIFSLGVWWNIFCLDFMLCIKLWRENWWSCFLSIQCFSFFTARKKHQKQDGLLPPTSPPTTHPPHHPPAFCMNQIVAELCCGGWKFDFLFLLSPLSPLRFA